jgi:uncharacterized protein YgfB (UPF0149 family)
VTEENDMSATEKPSGKTVIPYGALQNHLQDNKLLASPAELHGNLTGQLLVNPALAGEHWQHMVLEDYGFEENPGPGLKTVLDAFFEMTRDRLQRDDFSFDLLLPDEGELGQRVASLANWVNAFLSGLALGGLKSEKGLSADSREFLRDLAEIARLDDQVEENQGEEADLMELQEYVRAGVMLLADDLRQVPVAAGTGPLGMPPSKRPN